MFVIITVPISFLYPCTCSYFVVALDFETFYPQMPQQPRWIQAMAEESSRMLSRHLPVTEATVQEQFTKYFGGKQAVKLRVSFQ